MLGELDEGQVIYKHLIDDYETLNDVAKLGRKYNGYAAISLSLFVCFGLIGAFLKDIDVTIAAFFGILAFISFLIFVRNASKGARYSLSSEDKIFLNCFTAYEKLQTYKQRHSDLYLDEAIKNIDTVARVLSKRGTEASPWEIINQLNEKLNSLGEIVQKKILTNLSKTTSDEDMEIMSLAIIKLADVMRNTSMSKIEDFLESLRTEEKLVERRYISGPRKIVSALRRHVLLWEFTKAIGLFGFSALVVLGFSYMLCLGVREEFSKNIGYVIAGTIALFIALYLKKR